MVGGKNMPGEGYLVIHGNNSTGYKGLSAVLGHLEVTVKTKQNKCKP